MSDMHADLRDLYRTGMFSITELVKLSGLSQIVVESIVKKVRVDFKYGDFEGYFFIWPYGSKWQWEALGNQGEEKTIESAIEAARLWVRESRSRL